MNRHSRSSAPNHALAWALLSQSLWLPLLALDVHDRWQAQIRVQREIAKARFAALSGERIHRTSDLVP
jgi:hypothetical protein